MKKVKCLTCKKELKYDGLVVVEAYQVHQLIPGFTQLGFI